jgi:hypothetical protein
LADLNGFERAHGPATIDDEVAARHQPITGDRIAAV